MLNVENVTGGYSQTCIIKGVSFRVEKGQLFGILGPNGSGKSTLMKMVSGILPYQTGRIFLDGRPLGDYSSKQLARKMAALPQHTSEAFSYTVKEVVSIGRYAHQSGWLGSWTEEDERAVAKAMEQTGVNKFAESPLLELSGGERQRVYLAQALAQEPEILLLDEPTNHLDLAYQKELLDFLLQLTKETGLTVLSIFHDLNLAGLYCDQLMLMEDGKVNLNGQPEDVLQEKRINEVYATNTVKHAHPQMAAPQIALMRGGDDLDHQLVIDDSCLSFGNGYVCLKPQEPLWTLAYGGEGAGMGWRKGFAIFQPCEGGPAEKLKELGIRPGEALVTVSQDLGQTRTMFKKKGEFSVFSLAAKGAGEDGALILWLFVNVPVSEEGYLKMLSSVTSGLGKARPQYVFHPKDCLAVAGKKAVAGEANEGRESLWALVEEAAFKAADGLLSGSALVRTKEYKGE